MLRCEATGNGTLNYQWKKIIISQPDKILSDEAKNILIIKNISVLNNGKYYCEVDNGGAKVSSMTVQVTARGTYLRYNRMCYSDLFI